MLNFLSVCLRHTFHGPLDSASLLTARIRTAKANPFVFNSAQRYAVTSAQARYCVTRSPETNILPRQPLKDKPSTVPVALMPARTATANVASICGSARAPIWPSNDWLAVTA